MAARKTKERTCKMCHSSVPQNVAGHRCPHDVQCRYRLRSDGSVLDWTTPECEACEGASMRPKLVLSEKAIDMLG